MIKWMQPLFILAVAFGLLMFLTYGLYYRSEQLANWMASLSLRPVSSEEIRGLPGVLKGMGIIVAFSILVLVVWVVIIVRGIAGF